MCKNNVHIQSKQLACYRTHPHTFQNCTFKFNLKYNQKIQSFFKYIRLIMISDQCCKCNEFYYILKHLNNMRKRRPIKYEKRDYQCAEHQPESSKYEVRTNEYQVGGGILAGSSEKPLERRSFWLTSNCVFVFATILTESQHGY